MFGAVLLLKKECMHCQMIRKDCLFSVHNCMRVCFLYKKGNRFSLPILLAIMLCVKYKSPFICLLTHTLSLGKDYTMQYRKRYPMESYNE